MQREISCFSILSNANGSVHSNVINYVVVYLRGVINVAILKFPICTRGAGFARTILTHC